MILKNSTIYLNLIFAIALVDPIPGAYQIAEFSKQLKVENIKDYLFYFLQYFIYFCAGQLTLTKKYSADNVLKKIASACVIDGNILPNFLINKCGLRLQQICNNLRLSKSE